MGPKFKLISGLIVLLDLSEVLCPDIAIFFKIFVIQFEDLGGEALWGCFASNDFDGASDEFTGEDVARQVMIELLGEVDWVDSCQLDLFGLSVDFEGAELCVGVGEKGVDFGV